MKNIYLITISLLMVCSACDWFENDDLELQIYNASDKPIYTSWTTEYPDTSFLYMLNPVLNPQIYKVAGNSIQESLYNPPTKASFGDKLDTLSVFIFDAQVLETTPWDSVIANYLVLKRYDLSLEDLNRLNWVVTYP